MREIAEQQRGTEMLLMLLMMTMMMVMMMVVVVMMTCAEVKSDAAEKVVADESVEVPDGQLDAAVLQFEPRDAFEDEGVVPRGITVAPDDRAPVCC